MEAAARDHRALHLAHAAVVERERPGEPVVADRELPRLRVERVAGQPGGGVGRRRRTHPAMSAGGSERRSSDMKE